MARHLIYFIHADPRVRGRYESALGPLGEFDLKIVFAGNFSSAYARLAATLQDGEGRHLPGLLAKHPPRRPVGEYATTSLITFSAGYALARALLAHEADRAALSAYVAIDSIHASFRPDRSIDPALLAGFEAYARRAKAGEALFWIGHSDVPTPQPPDPKAFASTTQAAGEILRLAAGPGGHFLVRPYNVRPGAHAEHVAALTEWGPAFVGEALVPWLVAKGGAVAVPTETPPPWQDPSISLGMRCVLVARREMERGVQEEPLGSKTSARIREYFANCERNGKPLGLTKGDWCAAGACFAATRALLPGETLPHRYRASGIELQQDLTAAGGWRPLSSVANGEFAPEPGDLVILKRGTEAWMRHVCRVVEVDLAGGTVTTIGANENDRWSITKRPLAAPLLGFGEYPALAPRPAVDVGPDAELAAVIGGMTPERYDSAVAGEPSRGTTPPSASRALLDAARLAKAEKYNASVAAHLWRQADLGEGALRTAPPSSAAFAEAVAAVQKSAGLGVDGKLGADTLKVLRARQVVRTTPGGEIPKVETPLSEVELACMLREGHVMACGKLPTDARLGCAWAQCALEHGRGKFVYCNNLGNISAFGAWPGSCYVIRVSERIKRDPDEWKVIAMKFRAHASPADGAADYWRLLTNGRYAPAAALFDAGNPDGAARKLSELGYYTAKVDPYATAMKRLYGEFTSKILGRLPPAAAATEGASTVPIAVAVEAPVLDETYRNYLGGLVAMSLDTMARGLVGSDAAPTMDG